MIDNRSYMERYAVEIKNALSGRARYEALAEECAELAQACLKMCRIIGAENPVPLSAENVIDSVTEELLDVLSCMVVCALSDDVSADDAVKAFTTDLRNYPKWKRWAFRLRDVNKEANNGTT